MKISTFLAFLLLLSFHLYALDGHIIKTDYTSTIYATATVKQNGTTHYPSINGSANVRSFTRCAGADWMVVTVNVTDSGTIYFDDRGSSIFARLFVEFLGLDEPSSRYLYNQASHPSNNPKTSCTFYSEKAAVFFYVTPTENTIAESALSMYENYADFSITVEHYARCNVSLDSKKELADHKAANASVQIKAKSQSESWTATSKDNWIKLTTQSGKGTQQLSFSVEKNTSRKSRSGTITVTSAANPKCSHSCTIVQPGDATVTLADMELSGESTIAKASAQYSATLVYSNGEREEATGVNWKTDSEFATVNSAGTLVNSNYSGKDLAVSLTATKDGMSKTKKITLRSGHITRTEISGEDEIDTSAQYSFVIYRDNWGTQESVVPEWTVSEPLLASVSSTGVVTNTNACSEALSVSLQAKYETYTAEKEITLQRRTFKIQYFLASKYGLENKVKLQWFPVPGKSYFRIWKGLYGNKLNDNLDDAELICDWTKEDGNYCYYADDDGSSSHASYYCLQVADDANGTNASGNCWTEQEGCGYPSNAIFPVYYDYNQGLQYQSEEKYVPACMGYLDYDSLKKAYVLQFISCNLVDFGSGRSINYLSSFEGKSGNTIFHSSNAYYAYFDYYHIRDGVKYITYSVTRKCDTLNFIGGWIHLTGYEHKGRGEYANKPLQEYTRQSISNFLQHVVMPEVIYGGRAMSSTSPRVQLAGTPSLYASKALPGRIHLMWEPVYGVYRFHLFRKGPADTDYQEIASLDAEHTSYTDYGVEANTTYNYSIQIETISSTGDRFWGYESETSYAEGNCIPAMQLLKLQKGANLFSLDLVPNDESLALLKSNLSGIFAWNPQTKRFEPVTEEWPNGAGILGIAQASATLLLSGTQFDASVFSLHQGWNLVGGAALVHMKNDTRKFSLDNSVYVNKNESNADSGEAYWIYNVQK